MKCFYHKSDLDGHCSGAIVKYFFPECEMTGVDYKSVLDLDEIGRDETVYVLDFSFDRETMDKLNQKAELIWMDHHKSSIDDCAGLFIEGLRRIGSAGCELTWEYLCVSGQVFRTMPQAVHYIGRHDVLDHSDPNVLLFQYGMRSLEYTHPGSEIWKEVLERFNPKRVDDLIKIGRITLSYQENQNKLIAGAMAYEAIFHGYRAIVMNLPFANSQVFKSVYDPDKHDIMVLFGIKNGEVKYTLFCDKPDIDVSEIAKQYGGGGHRGAAGFYSEGIIL